MSESLTKINQENTEFLLVSKKPDSLLLRHEMQLFDGSLQLAKSNVTEPGESDLISSLEKNYLNYNDSVISFIRSPYQVGTARYIHEKFDTLYNQLTRLSQMNEKASTGSALMRIATLTRLPVRKPVTS